MQLATSLRTVDPKIVADYNEGYHHGYTKASPRQDGSETYWRAYIAGVEGRLEDEEAISSGTFDLLTDDERRQVYGDESP